MSISTHPSRVLLALGERSDQQTRRVHLEQAGYSVTAAGDLAAMLTLVESFDPHLLLMDTSYDINSAITEIHRRSNCLVVVLQSVPHPDARVRMLRDGADDVLPAAIGSAELDARCAAMLRRVLIRDDANTTPDLVRVGPLEIDNHRHELRLCDVVVHVTRIEFALIEQLALGGDSVSAREHLIEQVWGPHWVGDPHVVDVHLSNLRRKLDHALPGTEVIHTVRGVGFRLSDDLLNLRSDETETALQHT